MDRERAGERKSSSLLFLMFRGNFALAFGVSLVIFWILLSILAPMLTANPNEMNPAAMLQAPSPHHWFGTDNFGRDIFSRTLWGGRITLITAIGSSALAALIGTTIGTTAASFGGLVDTVLMRIVDIIFAFPAILGALAIASITGGV